MIFDDADGGWLVQTVALAPAAGEPGRIGAVYVNATPTSYGVWRRRCDGAVLRRPPREDAIPGAARDVTSGTAASS